MAYLKFTIDYHTEKSGDRFQRSGIAVKNVPWPDDLKEMTPEDARVAVQKHEDALGALSRHIKMKMISAGLLTEEEADQIKPAEPVIDAWCPEE